MAIVTEINDNTHMDTDAAPRSSIRDEPTTSTSTGMADPQVSGFFGSLAESIFEPGVNKSLFQAMNFSFLALVLTLLVMAYMTSFNGHVVFLMVVSTGLWVTMIWFVTEISKIQTQPQNAPAATAAAGTTTTPLLNLDPEFESEFESSGKSIHPTPPMTEAQEEEEEEEGEGRKGSVRPAGRSSAREDLTRQTRKRTS